MPAQAPTSKLYLQASAGVAAGWAINKALYVQTGSGVGSTWTPLKGLWVQKGAGVNNQWEVEYSTPTVSANNCSGSNSGADTQGSVTSGTPGASLGGYYSSPVYTWFYYSGDTNIACSNTGLLNPTWSYGAVVGGISAVWGMYATDSTTGAVSNTVYITVSLSWTNTFSAVTHTYSAGQSGGETIPGGCSLLTIVAAGGGGGAAGGGTISGNGYGGGGAGAAIMVFTTGIGRGNYGQVINFSVGNGGVGGGVNTAGGAGGATATTTVIGMNAGGGAGGTASGSTKAPGGVGTGSGTTYNGSDGFEAVFGGIGGNGGTNYPGPPGPYNAPSGSNCTQHGASPNAAGGFLYFFWS